MLQVTEPSSGQEQEPAPTSLPRALSPVSPLCPSVRALITSPCLFSWPRIPHPHDTGSSLPCWARWVDSEEKIVSFPPAFPKLPA